MLHKAVVLGAEVVGHGHEVLQQRQDHGCRGARRHEVSLHAFIMVGWLKSARII